MISKAAILVLSLSGAVAAAGEDTASYLSYPLGEDRLSLVYVMKNKETDAEAKKLAKEKGTEMLCKKGYSYTLLVSESKVMVIAAPPRPAEEYAYSDQRSRSLVEQNSSDPKPSVNNEGAENYPGYKVVMQGYHKNPGGKGVTSCSTSE